MRKERKWLGRWLIVSIHFDNNTFSRQWTQQNKAIRFCTIEQANALKTHTFGAWCSPRFFTWVSTGGLDVCVMLVRRAHCTWIGHQVTKAREAEDGAGEGWKIRCVLWTCIAQWPMCRKCIMLTNLTITKGSWRATWVLLALAIMYYNLELGLCIEFGPVRRDPFSHGPPRIKSPMSLFGSQSRSEQELEQSFDSRTASERFATFRAPPPISSV